MRPNSRNASTFLSGPQPVAHEFQVQQAERVAISLIADPGTSACLWTARGQRPQRNCWLRQSRATRNWSSLTFVLETSGLIVKSDCAAAAGIGGGELKQDAE